MGGATRFLVLLATPFPPRTPSLLRLARHHHYRHCLSPLASRSSPRNLTGSSRCVGSFRVNSSSSQQLHSQAVTFRDDHLSESAPPKHAGAQHPWPEWLELLGNLSAGGHLKGGSGASSPEVECEDEYAVGVSLQEDFVSAARACLAFARDRPHLLPALPRNDVEIVVNNGTPFLFKNADDSIRRMRSFLSGGEVEDSNKPRTIDLMRFLLSYASNPMMDVAANFGSQELVVSSVRNLIGELVKLSSTASGMKLSNPIQNQFTGRYGQSSRFRGQNIEMKRGDWICPRCSFMNFARNMKCLQCEEARPKRQLTGGEWECPQCNFLNHGRNMACLRCDCKHPGGFSPMSSGYSSGNNADSADLERRLAANEEKAQRWFSKVSQIDSTSDLNSAIDDEDFPEIMPLRKGVNRFVVSTRKTPLERRLANAKNSSSDGALAPNDSQIRNANNKTADSLLSRGLDDNLGHKSDDKMNSGVRNDVSTDSTPPYSNSPCPQQGYAQESNSSYVPFVPLPEDMFAKKPENPATKDGKATEKGSSLSSNSKEQTSAAVNSPSNVSADKDREQEEKSERWFKRITELHNEQDLTTAISDEDFPEIMPMRKGENRFVVSKKKDRSLTSPIYKRRAAMEQASNFNSNYVPFVPFPPDYFARKETQQSNVGNSVDGAADGISSTSSKPQEQKTENSEVSLGNWNRKSFEGNATNQVGSSENSTREFKDSQTSSNTTNMNEGTNTTSNWSGKSLEGSAVKEPDPLDMSEEAKAERWFRRVAQIKDISELSQIPDEDFPSIMPMRKGVNRFVVSKRKTPLERRLTSSQYRRNLPVVSSESIKKDNESD